jgi:hypothetical protein
MEFIVCIRPHFRKLFATDPFPTCFSSYVKRNINCYEGHYEPTYGGKKNGELGDKINDVIVRYTKKSCVTEVRLRHTLETVVPAVGYFNGACLCRRVYFFLLGIEYEDQFLGNGGRFSSFWNRENI